MRWPLAGVTAPEKHLLRIRLHGKYPQWKYWMAMPFTAPMPWEAGDGARGLEERMQDLLRQDEQVQRSSSCVQ